MATQNKLPKGPSNSAGMGATPGTQQTAMNNVRSMNINPNMPVAPQVAKQSRSSFQRSLEGTAGMPAPRPVQPKPAAPKAAPRVVSQAMPMDPGRGYNIFSGMDASQISGMNQSMGLSNMTSLPAVAPAIKPSILGPEAQQEPEQMFGQLMSGEISQEDTSSFEDGGVTYQYDPDTGTVQGFINGVPVGNPKELNDMYAEEGSDLEAWLVSLGYEKPKKSEESVDLEESGALPSSDDILMDAITSEQEADQGADPAKLAAGKTESEQKVEEYKQEVGQKKQEAFDNLDDMAATQLQQQLLGIDRQMAMAGMFGSGVHTSAINNVAAQVLNGLLAEYNDLNQQELDLISKFSSQELSDLTGYNILDLNFDQQDEQEYFQNMLAASQLLAQKETLEEDDINEILNVGEFLNSTVTDDLNSYIQGDLNNTDPVAKQAYLAILADIQFELMQKAMPPNAELTVEEAVSQYTAAADLLSQAMIAHVTQSKTSKNPFEVMKHLNKLSEDFGIDIPNIFNNFANGDWSWNV